MAAPDGGDWPDNHRRFALLGWVAAALAQGADPNWRPDILHCHDWHAGLAPAYLRAAGRAAAERLHGPQPGLSGLFPGRRFPDLSLPASFFAIDGVEFYGGLSFFKAGLFYADRLTTVSPTYAREIQTPAFGEGLDGLLRARADVLTGILNGVDPKVWDRRTAIALLPRALRCRRRRDRQGGGEGGAGAALWSRGAARAPLFGVVTRLTPQKGSTCCSPRCPASLARRRPARAARQRRRVISKPALPRRRSACAAASGSRSAMTRRCRT